MKTKTQEKIGECGSRLLKEIKLGGERWSEQRKGRGESGEEGAFLLKKKNIPTQGHWVSAKAVASMTQTIDSNMISMAELTQGMDAMQECCSDTYELAAKP